MNKNILKTIGYLLLSFLVNSCGAPLLIEKPVESYIPSSIAPALSQIPMSIDIDVKKLEKSVNRKLSGFIYSGDSLFDINLSVKVWKVQDFIFDVKNNTIIYKLPLKVSAKYRWKVEKFGLSVSDEYQAIGSISLSFKTSLFINKDWKLFARTESLGYQWIEEPKLNIAGVKLPVTKIADVALKNSQESITKSIDKALSEAVKLQDHVKTAWEMIQKPMLISPQNNIWIKITPNDIFVSPFISKNNILTLAFAFETRIESVVGTEPISGDYIPVPMFKQISKEPQPFNLNIAADITYDKLAQISKTQLIGKTFTEGNKSITIKELMLYSHDGNVIVAADVEGSIKGRIYFTGKMGYNQATSKLEIIDYDFDIKTKNVLIKSASWLLHGLILKKITPYLSYNIADVLEGAKKEANVQLTKYEIYEGISLVGSLDKLSVTEISMVPGAVRINATLRGNIAIKVDDLKF